MVVMDTLRACATTGWLLAATVAIPAQDQATPNAPGKLTDANFAKWRDLVLPTAEESAWLRIGWRSQLHIAMRDADQLNRPVLLWAMNGHPLGCV